ncbi:MAG: sigma-70 family RNA polymerase sigma factor [Planctomycetales bacterium]|nr:sigma-70 family RNA polymerase sigma factor [Planctomycetales bacterium]
MLSRRVGLQHVELVEDAVQSALLKSLESWTAVGAPADPSAWLYRVAYREVLGELRRQSGRRRHLRRLAVETLGDDEVASQLPQPDALGDDLLRMLFVCCDVSIPVESQLAFALKTLCGFSVSEIALRLFASEANVYKRLGRARDRLRQLPRDFDAFDREQCAERLPAVRQVLYLIFTEGYLSSHAESAVRRELCDEAIRLAEILAEHPLGQAPESYALLALMFLQAARFDSRQDAAGGLLLLEEQDRSRWDRGIICRGLWWLGKSAEGDCFSRFHAEAGIAAEHCLAPSFGETRWDRVASCYELLERHAPSPMHTLNRAVAVAEWQGPHQGLALLADLEPPTWLAASYLWSAVLADLHRRCGNDERYHHYRELALDTAPTAPIRDLLRRRLTAAE